MEYLKWAGQGIRSAVHAYNSINPATLSGAIDIVVCEHENGDLVASPFQVRFGKLGVLSPKEQIVHLSVNGSTVKDLSMKLGEQGEAFFVVEGDDDDITSPLSLSPDPSRPSTPHKNGPSQQHRESQHGRKKKMIHRKREINNNRVSYKSESEEEILNDPELEFDPELITEGVQTPPNIPENGSEDIEEVKNRLFHLHALNLEDQSKIRRNSANDADRNNPLEDWDSSSQPITIQEKKSPTELKHMLLERIHSESPSTLVSITSNQPIRRRRRYDSEPAMATPHIQLNGSFGEASTSPKSDAIDSGTDCLAYQSDDEVANEVAMSLCGGLTENNNILDRDAFNSKIISFEDFNSNPMKYVTNPLLVVKLGAKYYNWQAASTLFFSLIIFNKPVDEKKIDELQESSLPRRSWFRWSSSSSSSRRPVPEDGRPRHVSVSATTSPIKSVKPSVPNNRHSFNICDEKRLERSMSDPGNDFEVYSPTTMTSSLPNGMKKTINLGSDDLKKLNLRYGENEVCFWVTTMYQGTCRVTASVYKWKESDKIVISDIDGTITKSDVMGYIFPSIGKDWTQEGVTKLYKKINDNGYKFLYLSSRAIGQASMTKSYLEWVNQDGIPLPRGPVMLNPTSLFSAFHKEVIARKPEEFKISCLQGIKNIFPNSQKSNPFWAGFGNRLTDVKSYRALSIDDRRIFIINHLGQLKQQGKIKNFTISYKELSLQSDHFFPDASKECLLAKNESVSPINYWKVDLPDINFNDLT